MGVEGDNEFGLRNSDHSKWKNVYEVLIPSKICSKWYVLITLLWMKYGSRNVQEAVTKQGRVQERCQRPTYIFLGSNHKTLIMLSQDFWEDEVSRADRIQEKLHVLRIWEDIQHRNRKGWTEPDREHTVNEAKRGKII